MYTHQYPFGVATMDGGATYLDPQRVKALSALEPARALLSIAVDWLAIAAAIALCVRFPNVLVYIAAIIVIGSRQHALGIIGHDASHYRLFKRRWLNEAVGNLVLMWPLLMSLNGYRAFHLPHHRHLNDDRDGNRALWLTHTSEGELEPDWAFPRDRRDFFIKLIQHTLLPIGRQSGARMIVAMFQMTSRADHVRQLLFYLLPAALFTVQGWWLEFLLLWIVPMSTWSRTCNYLRTVAEHSAVHSDDAAFSETRTTVARWWEAVLFLPHNIGYHIEHHAYPSVPFYNLPALHRELMKEDRFRAGANVSRSFLASMREVTTARAELAPAE